jgi:glycosyltransferase involved in cell wall biosynthesis
MFTSHGPNYERFNDTKINRLLQRTRIALLKTADANMCYTAEGKRYLSRFIPEDQLFVANNTLPPIFKPMYEPPPRHSAGPVILSVGRMAPEKNFPLLITAFRHFHVRFSQAKLVIIGSGPDYEHCVEMAGDLMNRSVFLPGAIYDEAILAKYFNEADLFVLGGAAGLSVNHALFYGLPVMIFRRTKDGPHHGPEAEYVVDGCTGWQVEAYSSDGLAAALIKIFSGKGAPRSELKESIKTFVETEISFENMVDNFVTASNALLSGRLAPTKQKSEHVAR